MGFKLSAPKIKISAPKITADPTKIVKNAVNSVVNTTTSVTGSVLGGVGAVGGQTLNAAGSILSNPNAGSVLGGVGAAFGMPELGALGGLFSKPQADPGPQYTSEVPPQGVTYGPQASTGMSTNTMLAIGGGVLVLILGIVLIFKGKK